jgi:PIN domain nuclease of toxin-antitoxin system
MTVVLDASAVLAVLFDEPGAEKVKDYFGRSVICAVNVTEVVTKLVDNGRRSDAAMTAFGSLPVDVMAFDDVLALRAGALREMTRGRGLSLGDRGCLALAEREGVPAVTSDRRWVGLPLGVEIVLIR